MKRTEQKASIWQIAATYIGTIVGAGFASGQEVLQFFAYFGLWGYVALALTTVLFICFGLIILQLGRNLRATSHLPVIRYAGGRWLGTAVDAVITFFLFGALTAMVAGAGAAFAEQFRLPALAGNTLMVVATLLTVLLGLSGVIEAISLVVPALLGAVFAVAILSLIHGPITVTPIAAPGAIQTAVPSWPLSAVTYASYNLVIAVAVLAPLGRVAASERALRWGAVLGGLGLGLGTLAILLVVNKNLPQAAGYQIPMVYIAGQFAYWIQIGYSLVLLAEIYTTAVGNLYGFVARLTDPEGPRFKLLTIGAATSAFVAAQLGFTTLVRVVYPAVGYAGFLLLGALLFRALTGGLSTVGQP
ncbi:MAG: hypothetical protein AB1331_09455 [Bacillota bacterium]